MNLFPHQFEAVQRMTMAPCFLLADEPGLGKTATLVCLVKNIYYGGNVLVICPRNVIKHWRETFKTWAPNLLMFVTVTNYERIGQITPALNPQIVILDESHKLKNEHSKRFLLLWELWRQWQTAAAMNSGGMRVYLATGTPVYSYPVDLMTALLLLGQLTVDKIPAFKMRYCNPQRRKMGSRWILDVRGASNLAELKKACEPFVLRRSFEDAGVQMPTLTLTDLTVAEKISDPEYLAAREDWKKWYVEHGGRPTGAAMARFTILRRLLALAKVPAAVEQAQDDLKAGQKVLVFTGFRDSAQAIHDIIAADGAKAGLILGGQSPATRQSVLDEFKNSKEPAALVATTESIGEGVDGLQECCRLCIFVDLDFEPAMFVQAIRRLWRLSQRHPVVVRRLFVEGDPMEEFIQENLLKKERVQRELGLDDAASMSRIRR